MSRALPAAARIRGSVLTIDIELAGRLHGAIALALQTFVKLSSIMDRLVPVYPAVALCAGR